VKDILTSNVAFASAGMAKLYGTTITGSGMQQITMSPERVGYFSQVPFLALWGVNDDPDSIHRGTKINDFLCAVPGSPGIELPPVPPIAENQTNRERYTSLTAGCGGACHNFIINPIGFAFENFDGVGRLRTTDNGKPVDTAASYPFAEGTKEYKNSTELMQIIASGSQAHQCFAKKVAGYALQRDLVEEDRPLVQALGKVSLEGNASVKAVMVALSKENAFRTHVGGAQLTARFSPSGRRRSTAARFCMAPVASPLVCPSSRACRSARPGRRTRSRSSPSSCARPAV
jgi:hypothetical protein